MQTANENDDEKDNHEAKQGDTRVERNHLISIEFILQRRFCRAELVINRAITK